MIHLGNFNWPHLEILFFSPGREVILKKSEKNFKGKEIFYKRERKRRGERKERERGNMLVLFLEECVLLPDCPGLPKDPRISPNSFRKTQM